MGRLAAPSDDECTHTVQYQEWAEQQELSLDAYSSTGDFGSWMLLDGTLAPPIKSYQGGKYNVGGVWKRAGQLPFHSVHEMKAARDAAAVAKRAKSEQAVAMELDTGDFAVGRRVFARGMGGDGEQQWFVAVVVAHRERFPPLQVKYLATHPDGKTCALALPVPCTAYVPATHLQLNEPLAT